MERRQDLGQKILTGILIGTITIVLFGFFWETFRKADEAIKGVSINTTSIAVLQEQYKGIERRLTNIEGYTKEIDKNVSTIAQNISVFLKNGRQN